MVRSLSVFFLTSLVSSRSLSGLGFRVSFAFEGFRAQGFSACRLRVYGL